VVTAIFISDHFYFSPKEIPGQPPGYYRRPKREYVIQINMQLWGFLVCEGVRVLVCVLVLVCFWLCVFVCPLCGLFVFLFLFVFFGFGFCCVFLCGFLCFNGFPFAVLKFLQSSIATGSIVAPTPPRPAARLVRRF
jgi:hypothetical protein